MIRVVIALIVLAVLPVGRAQAVTPPETDGTPTVQEMIVEAWPDDAEMALCLAKHESGFEPLAFNHETGTRGLMQIHPIHEQRLQRMGYSLDDLLDPLINLLVARAIYDDQGWAPWAARFLCM